MMCNKHCKQRDKFVNTLQNKDPEIFKNYLTSLRSKIDDSADSTKLYTCDINRMIILLNWCFKYKNNFFIDDIRRSLVLSLIQIYNKIKSNILCVNDNDILFGLSKNQLKQLRFVLSRYVMIHANLIDDPAHADLTSVVNIDSIKRCIIHVNDNIKKLDDETCPY